MNQQGNARLTAEDAATSINLILNNATATTDRNNIEGSSLVPPTQNSDGEGSGIFLARKFPFDINGGSIYYGIDDRNSQKRINVVVKCILTNYGLGDVNNEVNIKNFLEENSNRDEINQHVIIPSSIVTNRAQNIECNNKYYFLISRLANYGDMCEMGKLNPDYCRPFFRQMAEAVRYLHNLGIYHCDLKPENFTVHENEDGSFHVSVIDFGKAQIYSAQEVIIPWRRYGTTIYTPPELILSMTNSFDWRKADVWALGISLFRILTDNLLPPGCLADNMLPNVETTRIICQNLADLLVELPRDVIDLLQRMLRVDPLERISINEVLDHDWFIEF